MNGSLHQRAERLITAQRVEGISADDRKWLHQHLESCPRCSRYADSIENTLRSLRSLSIRVDPALIKATRMAVQLRARELQERPSRMLSLWVFSALSWILGIVTAPPLWRAFEWVGRKAGVPDFMWQMGFVLWFILPALIVAAVLMFQKPQATNYES
jgi:anti-sigma factor RsiW